MNAATDQASVVLTEWRAREEAVRARMSRSGLLRAEQIADKTGLQIFESMFAGDLPYPPIGDTLDFVPVEVERGRVVFQGRPQFRHYNPMGTVHGGWIATLLDSAVACAVHTTLPAGKSYTTLELKVNYVKALSDQVPLVRAEGKIVHVGGRVGTAEGRLMGPDGALYAHATTTCLIFEVPPR